MYRESFFVVEAPRLHLECEGESEGLIEAEEVIQSSLRESLW